MLDLDAWQALADPTSAELVRSAEAAVGPDADSPAPGTIERLRARWPAELVHAAVALAQARAKASGKFGHERAGRLIADPEGVQMASSWAAGAWKACRFHDRLGPGAAVLDLCCGIGGDAMPLAEAGLAVHAVDLDPARAWMAGHNAGCPATAMDLADATARRRLPAGAVHLDPARRDARGRIRRYADCTPGPETLAAIVAEQAGPAGSGAAIKLAPGIDAQLLPPGELEVISEGGRLTQAVLWTGALADGRADRQAAAPGPAPTGGPDPSSARRVRATRLGLDRTDPTAPPAVATLVGVAAPGTHSPTPHELGRFIHTIDPAVERAGLIHLLAAEHQAPLAHPGTGVLTADRPIGSPWLTPFELLADLPWKPKHARRWLREHRAGLVEVKTRGGVVGPDRLQRELRGPGDEAFTVFVLRFGRALRCLITRRTRPIDPHGS